jgi:hypothetical protein
MRYRNFNKCTVITETATREVWLPAILAREKFPVVLLKVGKNYSEAPKERQDREFWEVGVIKTVGEGALANDLMVEQIRQVFGVPYGD